MQRLARTLRHDSGPMADLAFMLLIFFLVTTTMEQEVGIPIELPPPHVEASPAKQSLHILLNGSNQMLLNGQMVEKSECNAIVFDHLSNSDELAIQLSTHEQASYDAYIQLYDAVRSAYLKLYQQEAQSNYGKPYHLLSPNEKNAIKQQHPMRIMEPEGL